MLKDDSFWLAQRHELFPAAKSINLNAGTLSQTPLPVLNAITRLRERQAAEPSDWMWRQAGPLLERSRLRLAAYLNTPSPELLLLPNVTHGINLAAASLSFGSGAEILMTDHEYGAMVYCWEKLARERGWTIRMVTIPYSSENSLDHLEVIENAITPATKVLFFSHVTTSTGLILPAAELCALARRRGLISVVDGAHATGMTPLDLNAIGADFYGGNCHKWLMTPIGCGFLAVRKELKGTLQPLVTSWGWKHTPDERELDSGEAGTKWQFTFEFQGCMERCPQMIIPEVLDVRESLGGEKAIYARAKNLAQHAREKIGALGFKPATPANATMCGALTAFEFPNIDQRKWRDWIWETHRIECPITKAAGRTFLRVSTAWYTTVDEVEKFVAVLKSGIPA